ncbi:MAG: hypothetical protein GXO47_02030 [Chlorobi bacterium]|nr:hypothetical protein [Chlorobiota bacterium]
MRVVTLLLLFFLSSLYVVAEKPRTPFVVLKVNGKEYMPGQEIPARFGENLSVEAVLKGGRRDYCSNPEKYANVGKNTVIVEKGENGMSFTINGKQFRGTWTLTEELAVFSTNPKTKITQTGTANIQRSAIIHIPQSNVSKIQLKVKSEAKWHYERRTPAGPKEKDEMSSAEATFYIVVKQEEGVWYSSANIIAKGDEDFTVRNELNEVQKFYNSIDKYLQEKNYAAAEREIGNLKTYVGEVKRAIEDAKKKNPDYNCEVVFVGLPTDRAMENYYKLSKLFDMWKERYIISQNNVAIINDMLLNTQMTFSANILKSIFKNYLSWTGNVPPNLEDIPGLMADGAIANLDMPRQIINWYLDAQKDASILKQQTETIKKLTELRTFYLDNISSFVTERKKIKEYMDAYDKEKEVSKKLKEYFKNIGWAEWREKEMF